MFSAKRLIRKIKEFRKRNKITQMTFAKQIGTCSSTLSKWESEKTNFNPDLKQIVGIAKAMGITPSELLSSDKTLAQVSSDDKGKETKKTARQTKKSSKSRMTTKTKRSSVSSTDETKQSKRTVKPSKTAAASKEIKVTKTGSTKESLTKKEMPKRKPGRPRKQKKII